MLRFLKQSLLHLPEPWRRPLQQLWRRLPPHDPRFLLQDLEDEARRSAFLHSAHYRRFAEQEGRFWSACQQCEEGDRAPAATAEPKNGAATFVPGRNLEYTAHPLIQRELQRRICPEGDDLWAWLGRRFGGREHGLVLGAGRGIHCRLLIDIGIVRRVTAFDLADESVRLAQAEFERLNYAIQYQACDLNFFPLAERRSDLCLAMYALHHLIDLEGVFAQLRRALDPEQGVLIMEDFVGPRFTEFPQSVREAAGSFFARLPPRLRVARDGRTVLKRLAFRDRWAVQRDSPFEAIRSDRILDLLRQSFAIEFLRERGEGLLMPLLAPIIQNFDPADEEANEWLRRILDEDWRLTRCGAIPNFVTFLAARPLA